MNKAFPILLALLLLSLSIVAAAFGMANIYQKEAATLRVDWDDSEDVEGAPPWAWEQAQRYLWLASRLAPFDPQILGDQGRLYDSRASATQASDASTEYERALGFYRQALALRPAWPYAWVDIAGLKIAQQRLDAEYLHAVQQALTLGPWQTKVQASIAFGGLMVWDMLPATLQTGVEKTIARGLLNDSRLMMTVAKHYDLVPTDGS